MLFICLTDLLTKLNFQLLKTWGFSVLGFLTCQFRFPPPPISLEWKMVSKWLLCQNDSWFLQNALAANSQFGLLMTSASFMCVGSHIVHQMSNCTDLHMAVELKCMIGHVKKKKIWALKFFIPGSQIYDPSETFGLFRLLCIYLHRL